MPSYSIFKADLAKENIHKVFSNIFFFLIWKNPIFSIITCELKTFSPPCLGKWSHLTSNITIPGSCITVIFLNTFKAGFSWISNSSTSPEKKRNCKMYIIFWGGRIRQGNGRYKLLGIRQAQGCVVQHEEDSQYFVITINGKQPLKIV